MKHIFSVVMLVGISLLFLASATLQAADVDETVSVKSLKELASSNVSQANSDLKEALAEMDIARKAFPIEEVISAYEETHAMSEEYRILARELSFLGKAVLRRQSLLSQAISQFNEVVFLQSQDKTMGEKVKEFDTIITLGEQQVKLVNAEFVQAVIILGML